MESRDQATNESFTVRELMSELVPAWSPDDWFEWPPDLFALTSHLLKSTGLYRVAASLRPGERTLDPTWWDAHSRRIVQDWYYWISGVGDSLPPELTALKETLTGDLRLNCYGDDLPPALCHAILELHAFADDACVNFGLFAGNDAPIYFLANLHLAATGSLSRLPKRHGVVLPKHRTPQTGLSPRSLSLHVTYHQSEVNVHWRAIPWVNRHRNENTINVVVVPWPYRIRSSDFSRVVTPASDLERERFHYFRYGGGEPLDLERVFRLLTEVYADIDTVDLLVFPEAALTRQELGELRDGLVSRFGGTRALPLVVAGVRGREGDLDTNEVVLSAFFVGGWYEVGQHKHHRWKLDETQIQQYGLAASLNVRHQWWEAVHVPHRCLSFLVPNGWLNLCPLICEDLAQLEPVSDVIRGVGPTFVIAVLMDGPQIADRWPARYVGVLADDPGTSVLSVTSLGMAKRAIPRGREVNLTTVAWKDRRTGWEPIKVCDADTAVLLTLNAEWVEEFAADGRSDHGTASLVVFQNARCITVPAEAAADPPRTDTPPPGAEGGAGVATDVLKLTVFSYLVDAAVDAGGGRVELLCDLALLDDGSAGGPSAARPLLSLLERTRAALSGIGSDRNADQPWSGADFARAIEMLRDFLSAFNAAGTPPDDERASALFDRWEALAAAVEGRLAEEVDGGDRTRRVVYVSLLWAIHTRLILTKRQVLAGELADHPRITVHRCRHLLDRVEETLRSYSGTPQPAGA